MGSDNNILLLLRCQLLSSGFQGHLENLLFGNRVSRHRNTPFLVKHVGDAATRREIAIVLAKNPANLCSGPVLVIGRRFHDHGNTTRSIAFIDNLVEMLRFYSLARAAFDRTFDAVIRHALSARGQNCAAKTHVGIGITATDFRSDGDLAGEFAKKCATLRVERAFEAFNLGPLAVSRHEMGILFKTTLPDKLGSRETRNRSASKKNRYRGGKRTLKSNRVSEFLSRRGFSR